MTHRIKLESGRKVRAGTVLEGVGEQIPMGISFNPRLPVWRNTVTTSGRALGREDGRRR
jgi:hypothetical protein